MLRLKPFRNSQTIDRNGADINAYESSTTAALNEVAAKGHFEIVRYLIEKGV